MPIDRSFKHRRDSLLISINTLGGAFMHAFPDGHDPTDDGGPAFPPRGTTGDEPMRSIAGRLNDVLFNFDMLQRTLGLPRGEPPRFQEFMAGKGYPGYGDDRSTTTPLRTVDRPMPPRELPPPPTEQQAAFDRQRDQLKDYLFQTLWLLDDTLPRGYAWPPDDPNVTGAAHDYPMKALKDGIDNILASFDCLQVAMGEDEGRHHRFLTGRCHG